MALIRCPECGREVSSAAAQCPTCAYPVGKEAPAVQPTAAVKPHSFRSWLWPGFSMLARVVVGIILIAVGAEGDDGGAAVGGLIIGGSAVPTFFRAWKARVLAPQRQPAALPDGLADRMLEMEQMHREQMADLEERVDFAERLLTKQREQIDPG